MATNVTKTHFLKTLNKRKFASACLKYPGIYSNDVKVETLPNKLLIASVDSTLPLSRLSVIIKAGSRYDPTEHHGLNHVLRSSAGLTTSQSSFFGIIRNIQQIGGNIQVYGNRDTITYTLEATSDNIDKGLKFLKDVVANQVFKPWELEDNIPRIKYEIASLPPQAKLLDLLHKAAYRNGLGNPLFAKEYQVGQIGSETLQHFVSQAFTSNRSAVVGLGINHDTVINFAGDLGLGVSSGPEVPATYYGGELSEDAPVRNTHIALVSKASGLKDSDLATFAVLKHALGGWSSIKWSAGNSLLSKVVHSVDKHAFVSSLNIVHADSGLFGVIVSTSASKAKSAIFAAANLLKQDIPKDTIEKAKNSLKNEIFEANQNGEELSADIASQIIIKGDYTSPSELADSIDAVSSSDIAAVLKKLSSGKKSLATYGNLADTPYLDEFK